MINVTQKSETEFIIEWDENDPGESIFNSFTEKDFIDLLEYYSKKELNKIKNSSSTQEEHGEAYYNSESEGKEFDRKEISKRLKKIYKAREQVYDNYIQAINEDTYGEEWRTYHQDNTEAP